MRDLNTIQAHRSTVSSKLEKRSDKVTTGASALRAHQDQVIDLMESQLTTGPHQSHQQKANQRNRLQNYNSMHRDMVTKKTLEQTDQSYDNWTFIPKFADKTFLA